VILFSVLSEKYLALASVASFKLRIEVLSAFRNPFTQMILLASMKKSTRTFFPLRGCFRNSHIPHCFLQEGKEAKANRLLSFSLAAKKVKHLAPVLLVVHYREYIPYRPTQAEQSHGNL
jgi:hypothetical protein